MATAAKKQAPAAKTATPSKSREVATSESFDISTDRPTFIKEGNRGAENVTHSDLVIPRLEIVQSLSPARNKSHPDYIPGAEEGVLYNNVTREIYGESVVVVPVYFTKEWLIWKDRSKGGGFRGAYPTKAEADDAILSLKDKDGKAENPDDFTALDTAQHFCLLVGPKSLQQVVLSMSKSKMKVSRKWNSLIALSGDDSFARAYLVESVDDKNQQNQDFKNIKISVKGYVSEQIYAAAEKAYKTFSTGGARADTSGFDPEEESRTTVNSKEF